MVKLMVLPDFTAVPLGGLNVTVGFWANPRPANVRNARIPTKLCLIDFFIVSVFNG